MKTPTLARLAVFTALLLHSAPQAFGFGAGSNTFATATLANDGSLVSIQTYLSAFTAEAGEPGHRINGSNGGLKTAWWTYTPKQSGYLTVDTMQNAANADGVYDTLLGVYTGSAVNNLTRVAHNDDYGIENIEGQFRQSQVSFYAVKDTKYYIAIDGYESAEINANRFTVTLSIRLFPLRALTRTGILTLGSTADKVGTLTYTTTPTGSYTGKVTLGGKVTSVSGVFTHDGYTTVVIPRPVAANVTPLLPYTIIIDGAIGGSAYIFSSDLTGNTTNLHEAVIYTKTSPNPFVGYYTGVADFGFNNAHGTITATVKTTGNVTGTFTALDGTTVTYSSPPYMNPGSNVSFLQVYRSLFTNQGYLYGSPGFVENGAIDVLFGSMNYSRPAAKANVPFYPNGIVDVANIQGGTYTKPAANTRALGFLDIIDGIGSMFLVDEGGDLGGNISESLTFTVTNKFLFNSLTRKPTLTLNTTTGLVTGSITAPPLKKRTIRGVLYRYNGGEFLKGHVTGTAKNLEMRVEP